MKNYIIGFLIVCLLVLGSFIYKLSRIPVFNEFPLSSVKNKNSDGEPPLYLFIFFSRNNCHTCLGAIQTLNKLPNQFIVTGIVPGNQLKEEGELRSATGATFKLIPYNDAYKRFKPHYSPTIFGVAGSGKILFTLPGVPEQNQYLYDFLVEFYGKSIELLIPSHR